MVTGGTTAIFHAGTAPRQRYQGLIRRFLCRRPARFRSVRDLGLVSPGCTAWSGSSRGCSSVWLPAWLPSPNALAARPAAVRIGSSRTNPVGRSPLDGATRRGTATQIATWPRLPRHAELRITRVSRCVARRFKARASFMFAGECWWLSLAPAGGSGARARSAQASAATGNVCPVGQFLPGGGAVRRTPDPACPPEHCLPGLARDGAFCPA